MFKNYSCSLSNNNAQLSKTFNHLSISQDIFTTQDVKKCVHWWSINLSKQTQQKDCCNSVWYDWLVQIKVKTSNAVLSTIRWIHHDLWHHWCLKQFRHQEKFVKVLEKRDTA